MSAGLKRENNIRLKNNLGIDSGTVSADSGGNGEDAGSVGFPTTSTKMHGNLYCVRVLVLAGTSNLVHWPI